MKKREYDETFQADNIHDLPSIQGPDGFKERKFMNFLYSSHPVFPALLCKLLFLFHREPCSAI